MLSNVFRAFTRDTKAYIQVGLFWVLVLYIFSVFIFSHGFFDYGFLVVDENQCTSLFNCFLSSFENIENDRTIQPSFREDYGLFLFNVRSWWNVWFAVINKYIIKNLYAAIIIGAFAGLRSMKGEIDEDNRNICFICNLDRVTLDQHGGFLDHIKKEHNLWHYFNFIFLLSTKNQSLLDGFENKIKEKVAPFSSLAHSFSQGFGWKQIYFNDHSWMPSFRSKSYNPEKEKETIELVLEKAEELEAKLAKSARISKRKMAQRMENDFI